MAVAETIPQHVLQRRHPGNEDLAALQLAGVDHVSAHALKQGNIKNYLKHCTFIAAIGCGLHLQWHLLAITIKVKTREKRKQTSTSTNFLVWCT